MLNVDRMRKANAARSAISGDSDKRELSAQELFSEILDHWLHQNNQPEPGSMKHSACVAKAKQEFARFQ